MKISTRTSSLREGMYEMGSSWFTAWLVLEPPGTHRIDYDSEPTYVPPLTAAAYALDFRHYPRSAEHIPDWLRGKLAEAATGKEEAS